GLAEVRLRVEPQPEESGGLLKSPVFWVVMGAVVVAGVVTAVLLSSSTADAKPTDDPVTGRAVTLVSF
ncbi:MAG: hypothetical protein KC417_12590, partial [Myxococcales bacterium]|nr:hypothetical protein [Myxococcales bacterium]